MTVISQFARIVRMYVYVWDLLSTNTFLNEKLLKNWGNMKYGVHSFGSICKICKHRHQVLVQSCMLLVSISNYLKIWLYFIVTYVVYFDQLLDAVPFSTFNFGFRRFFGDFSTENMKKSENQCFNLLFKAGWHSNTSQLQKALRGTSILSFWGSFFPIFVFFSSKLYRI